MHYDRVLSRELPLTNNALFFLSLRCLNGSAASFISVVFRGKRTSKLVLTRPKPNFKAELSMPLLNRLDYVIIDDCLVAIFSIR